MSGIEQEPVIEQSADSQESAVSAPMQEAPMTSTKTEEAVPKGPGLFPHRIHRCNSLNTLVFVYLLFVCYHY